jgi:4-amino-4-deoxy-L-arabinose transferase-like glycosyltransferase
MGLTPGTYFSSSNTLEITLGVLLLAAITGIAIRLLFARHQDPNTKLLISVFLVALLVLVVMAVVYGMSEYQTWKTAISVTPLLIIGAVTVLASWDRTKTSVSLFVCVVLGAGFASSSMNWMDLTQRNYVSHDLIAITQSIEYQSVMQIDVDLSPKLETMLAIPLLKGEVNLVSQSYLNTGRNARKFPCLLTRGSKAEVLGLMDDLVVQRGKYVIVGKNNCRS